MKRRGRKPEVTSLYKNGKRCTFYIKNDIKSKLAKLKENPRFSISDFVNTALDKQLKETLRIDSNNIRVVSLFSGCGGMDVGFKGNFKYLGKSYRSFGFDIVFANDIDKDACDTYKEYFKHTPVCADIKNYLPIFHKVFWYLSKLVHLYRQIRCKTAVSTPIVYCTNQIWLSG